MIQVWIGMVQIWVGTMRGSTSVALKEEYPDPQRHVIARVVREAKLLRAASHPNVIQLHGIWQRTTCGFARARMLLPIPVPRVLWVGLLRAIP